MYLSIELKLSDIDLTILLIDETNQGPVYLSTCSIDLDDLQKALDKRKLDKEHSKIVK